jgi:hypothetical protein
MTNFNILYSLRNLKNTFFEKRNNPILHNRYFLYFLLFLAIMEIFYFSTDDDQLSILFLFIIGFLISIFSKNMIIIIFFSIVLVNIIKYGSDVIPPPKINEGYYEYNTEMKQKEHNPTMPKNEKKDKHKNFNKDNNDKKT